MFYHKDGNEIEIDDTTWKNEGKVVVYVLIPQRNL